MQDRIRQIEEPSCDARPDHTIWVKPRSSGCFRYMSAQAPQAEIQAAQHDVSVVPEPDSWLGC
jgi:hypothetical protein